MLLTLPPLFWFLAAGLLLFAGLVVATYAIGLARDARRLAEQVAQAGSSLQTSLAVVEADLAEAAERIEDLGRSGTGRSRT